MCGVAGIADCYRKGSEYTRLCARPSRAAGAYEAKKCSIFFGDFSKLYHVHMKETAYVVVVVVVLLSKAAGNSGVVCR